MLELRMPALQGLLEIIQANPLVGLGEMHRSATEHEFLRELIVHPDFAADDLVIEFGNHRYQDVLDAYIGGEQVPLAELQQVWLNTTQSPNQVWDDMLYPELLATVREANQVGRNLRVLAADPPVDWSKVETMQDLAPYWDRQEYYLSVVENEVVSQGRRAVLLWGGMHLLRRDYHQPMKLPWVDRPLRETIGDRFPDMPIIEPHAGVGARNDEVEQVLADWPIPSIASIAGSALAGFALDHFAESGLVNGKPDTFRPWRWDQLFDYYLYLGPRSTLQWSSAASSADADPDFHAELHRRRVITGWV